MNGNLHFDERKQGPEQQTLANTDWQVSLLWNRYGGCTVQWANITTDGANLDRKAVGALLCDGVVRHFCFNCRSPDFKIITNPTRNLDRLYICLVVRLFVVRSYAEILQIPPDLPVQQNFPRTRPDQTRPN